MTDKEIRKQVRELTKTANDLAEQIRCNWNALPEERMIEIVKELKAIDKQIRELDQD